MFPIPDGVDDGDALALLIQGLTAWHLLQDAARARPRASRVVVISGAGGVGNLAVQLGKPMGAGRVIATASTEEKRAMALELGADAAVDPAADDLKAALIEANEGEPVDVVFEMAGGPRLRPVRRGARAVRPHRGLRHRGREQNTVETGRLMRKSRAVIGFWLMHCLGRPRHDGGAAARPLRARRPRRAARRRSASTYPLSEVRQAHEDLQGRRTTGKLLLDPSRVALSEPR